MIRTTLACLAVIVLLTATPAAEAGGPLWVQIAQLYGSDTDSQDSFGERVAIDGSTLVVGAFRKNGEDGAVYIFERVPEAPTEWLETKKLNPILGDKDFGLLVWVDGDTIAVHALPEAGSATYLYGRDVGGVGAWGLVTRLEVPVGGLGDLEGDNLAYSNSRADIGGNLAAGRALMFELGPNGPVDWHFVMTLTASDPRAQDHFGNRLVLSGDRLLVGVQDDRDLGLDAGAAYIFERDETGAWTEIVKLHRSDGDANDDFGDAIDLDGETAIIAGDADGEDEAAFIFEPDQAGNWLEVKRLLASDNSGAVAFGATAGISGDVAVVGAWGYELPDVNGAGAAYIFERHHGGTQEWGEIAKVLAADPQELDHFGRNLVLDQDSLVVGVPNDDDRGFQAGTVYLFSRTEPLLAITGSCPGEIEVSLIGTTPAGPVVLLGAQSEGVTPIPLGPCAGTDVDLDRPKVLFSGRATSGGDLALGRLVGAGTCGRYLQAVDIDTCTTSNVAQVP